MTSFEPPRAVPRTAGRYEVHGAIASGGMATVYFGRLAGPIGFSRVVAIKRMHPQLAMDRDFVAMFVDEATLASRVIHPNVVPILDIVVQGGEIFIVMEYVRGQSLAALLTSSLRAGAPVPVPIATAIMAGTLAGLHAAHEARDKRGKPLGIVHRDVSPQNVLVGADGVPRVMDFGVAKAETKLLHVAPDGLVVGKLSYMAPEQVRGDALDRRADVFAAAVVLWGMLAGRRLFRGEDASVMNDVLHAEIPPISRLRGDVSPALDAALAAALERDPSLRTPTARDFAIALEAAAPLATPSAVGAWVEHLAGPALAEREAMLAQIENTASAPASADLAALGSMAARAGAWPTEPDPAAPRAHDSVGPTRNWSPSTLESTPVRQANAHADFGGDARSGVAMTPALPAAGPSRLSAMLVMAASAAFATIALGAAVVVLMRTSAPAPPIPGSPGTTASAPASAATSTAAPEASAAPIAAASASAVSAASAEPTASAKPPTLPGPRKQYRPAKPRDDIGYIPSGNR